jgi:glycosyltransferase involved in cell wall biosynthesis
VNILYFTRDFSVHDARFLKALVRTRHKVHFLRLVPKTDLKGKIPKGVKELPFRNTKTEPAWWQYRTLARKFKELIKNQKFDVVHAGPIPRVALIPALAGFSHLVSMSWGSDLLYWVQRSPIQKTLTRYTLKRSQVLVGDCEAVRAAGEDFGMPREKFVLFPWGVDIEHFSPGDGNALRRRLGWQKNFVVLCVRSWERIYGVDVVLKAFREALQHQPGIRLLLLGSGSQRRNLEGYIRKHGLNESITTPGIITQEKLPMYYRAADLYVSASHCDGSSVSLLEALSCGLPALVSDIPANLEWVSQGKTGWLFPDGDHHALAKEMVRIKRQQEKRTKMKSTCRKMIVERADWGKNSKLLLKAYEMAMEGSS